MAGSRGCSSLGSLQMRSPREWEEASSTLPRSSGLKLSSVCNGLRSSNQCLKHAWHAFITLSSANEVNFTSHATRCRYNVLLAKVWSLTVSYSHCFECCQNANNFFTGRQRSSCVPSGVHWKRIMCRLRSRCQAEQGQQGCIPFEARL
jgi:hypothetical protein